MQVAIYWCGCGNAVTEATIAALLKDQPNFALDPSVRCNNESAHGRDPSRWPYMRHDYVGIGE